MFYLFEKSSGSKKFIRKDFSVKNPSDNQEKVYTFFLSNSGEKYSKATKVRENSGKSNIKNCCEPWNSITHLKPVLYFYKP